MTLFWSIRPFEQVMEGVEEVAQFEEMTVRGITMLVSPLGDNVRVERIISPNPRDYLNTSLQPGTVVNRNHL